MTPTTPARSPSVDSELLEVLLAYRQELTDEQIAEMLKSIRPVVRGEGGGLFYIEPVDPRKVSFLWDPILTGATSLTAITRIYSLHRWGYYGMFKPSLAEVLSMIPPHLLPRVAAFEVVGPRIQADLDRQWDAVNQGFHVAVAILYERASAV